MSGALVGNFWETSFVMGSKGGVPPNIYKLRIGAFIPRSVGRSVGWSVLQKLQKNYKTLQKRYKTLK